VLGLVRDHMQVDGKFHAHVFLLCERA
jgi:hypothetical protein